jgi:hypothetical protein
VRLGAVGAAALALAMGACGGKKATPAAADAAPAAAPDTLERGRPQRARGQLAPITIDEVAPLLVGPEEAATLKALDAARGGERIEASFCMDGELTAVVKAVEDRVSRSGWGKISVRTTSAKRATVTASRKPYVLYASVQRGAFAGCDEAAGKTFISMGAHKLVEEPVAPGTPAPVPGTVGPSGSTGMRVP